MEKSYRLTDNEAAAILTLLADSANHYGELAADPIDTEGKEVFQAAAERYKAIYNKIEKEFLNR